jgi:hypothetical protein
MSNDIVARHTMNDVVEYLHAMSREDLDEKHANVLKNAPLFFYSERCGTHRLPEIPYLVTCGDMWDCLKNQQYSACSAYDGQRGTPMWYLSSSPSGVYVCASLAGDLPCIALFACVNKCLQAIRGCNAKTSHQAPVVGVP